MLSLLAAALLALSPHGHRHGYPAEWRHEAACIRWEESRGEWHIGGGGFQIIPSTWAAGLKGWYGHPLRGWPNRAEYASPAQQTFVAWRIYVHNGRSWGANNQWPRSAAACGVR